MRRYLVVAHQTLKSPELLHALRQRMADDGPCSFHLLVPERQAGSGAIWTEAQVRAQASRQLDEALSRFIAEGLPVSGEVGEVNPVAAVTAVLHRDGVDSFVGIIVSTLPQAVSRWLNLDAPSRIERSVDLPVTHVVGHPADVT